MAKSLGFGPDALVRARPDPKQEWKLPVKYWIHGLHFKRFGFVIGEKPLPPPRPTTPKEDAEAARIYGEQVYWEEYWERNGDERPTTGKPSRPAPPDKIAPRPAAANSRIFSEIADDDLPF